MSAVTNPLDIRVHIPRFRRALDGPQAMSSAAPSSVLDDSEITAVIADALADTIFFSGGAFGAVLNVVERDTYYLSPIAWATEVALTDVELTVVVAQASLNYFHNLLATMKVEERIADEGQEWSYKFSAQSIAERIKALQKARDEALEQLAQDADNPVAWESFLAVRDARTSELIEPWVHGGGSVGGQTYDSRFGTPY